MLVRVSPSSLKDGKWHEYVVRFALGGAATVVTGLIAKGFGPAIGGLFLALPAIFCASVTLIETHEIRRKRHEGLAGKRRGREAAALDTAGAALGSIGLLAFAAVFTALVQSSVALAFVAATASWLTVAVTAWWIRRKLRVTTARKAAGRLDPDRQRSSPLISSPRR
ncbi:conserved membrane hypothetical protein; putative MFS general substrate transporter family [Bradyrhizobium sp. ORS 375]|uniref:hypothetical protein n=1 Tax=Bradyrhizobium sp. (strain ORS 375) TaxID=566679 RepID=UPI0002409C0F|nr:hypothetical protein [Bradyrhizobium sp. ORS 375]CCD93407.1 conserved membrane hypothetical protein; putative MFS general substrate transporter family [Bradyrhizobium sp. ORS 375]